MKLSKVFLVTIFSSLALTAYGVETFKVDAVHSSVIFSIKHLGVSDFYGAFKDISGSVNFDSTDPSKSTVELTIPVSALDTRNEKRDQHLKGPDFFNATQFPTITFKSTKVEGAGANFKVTGDLTLRGVTKPVSAEFKKGGETKGQKGETKTGGEARFTIKRSDFDMKYMIPQLGDEVNIIVSVEAVKE